MFDTIGSPLSLMSDNDMEYMSTTDNSCSQTSKPKRKRQRLDHLSHEEKLMRRKLKNRMAAQSARDRKKVKMQDLEQDVILLEKQRKSLENQNESLKERNSVLEQQNKELKQRLSLLESKQSIKVELNDSCGWSETIVSAELISGPQQKEQVSQPVMRALRASAQLLMRPFVYWLIIKNLMLCSMFYTCIPKNCSIQTPIRVQKYRQSMRTNANKWLIANKHHIWDQLKT